MKLYDFFRSSAAFRVRIALNLKRLPYERAFIHLRRNDQSAPSYLAVNPQGLVPALDEDGQIFTQSLGIFVLELVQLTIGYSHILWLHIPFGVALVVGTAMLMNQVMGPQPVTADAEAAV